MRQVLAVVAATVLAAAISVVLPVPAHGCSCATPSDLNEWVDQSEAVFVGTMVEKLVGGQDQFGGQEAIYVFEVETWVKGDLGDVIEVHSAADGAGCGFEFWTPERRTGAAIWEENGRLQGGLCSQVDADALVAAMKEPTPSATGIPKLIVANGWSSTRLTVLDENGDHVTELRPLVEEPDFSGTHKIDLCPDGDLMVQMTETSATVWDLSTLEPVATHELALSQNRWPTDLSCRNSDASSIWVLSGGEFDSALFEIVDGPEQLTEVPGVNGTIGAGLIVYQTGHDGDAVMLDLDTGEEHQLTAIPPNAIVGVASAPHPSEPMAAVLETRYHEDGTVATVLSVFDSHGRATSAFEIKGEGYWPVWLDDRRLGLTVQQWTAETVDITAHVFDIESGAAQTVPGWVGSNMVADGDILFGVDGGTIVTADLATNEVDELVTIASQQAGPVVVVDSAGPVQSATTTSTAGSDSTVTTIPPLVAPEIDGDGASVIQWVAGGAIVVFGGVLVWLGLHRPRIEEP